MPAKELNHNEVKLPLEWSQQLSYSLSQCQMNAALPTKPVRLKMGFPVSKFLPETWKWCSLLQKAADGSIGFKIVAILLILVCTSPPSPHTYTAARPSPLNWPATNNAVGPFYVWIPVVVLTLQEKRHLYLSGSLTCLTICPPPSCVQMPQLITQQPHEAGHKSWSLMSVFCCMTQNCVSKTYWIILKTNECHVDSPSCFKPLDASISFVDIFYLQHMYLYQHVLAEEFYFEPRTTNLT